MTTATKQFDIDLVTVLLQTLLAEHLITPSEYERLLAQQKNNL